MLNYKQYILDNGLRLLVHRDPKADIEALNMMYDAGSKDEDPSMTGLAHLFEHLMFEGSENVAGFDRELELAGGENNAFTNSDITNYYVILPAVNLETALWLESDRMNGLNLTRDKLDVQKSVVIEEFKERYLNQPYGDLWALTRSLSYKVHPYRWTTIGRDVSHLEKVTREDALNFYERFYTPGNAILSIVSPLAEEEVYNLVEKWFASLASAETKYVRSLPQEPEQKEPGFMEVERDVPSSMIVKTYHMADRRSSEYYIHDLISDLLANGESSRLKSELVKNKELFSQIDAYISGDIHPGLLIIAGKVNENVKTEDADRAVEDELERLKKYPIQENELQKVKNKALTHLEEEKNGVPEKAMNLAYSELLGDPEIYLSQEEYYRSITLEQMEEEIKNLFTESNKNTLYYKSREIFSGTTFWM